MKKNLLCKLVLGLTALWLMVPQNASACSTFVLENGGKLLFGRNYDFFTGNGAVIVNPRNLAKTALVYPGEIPASWTAKYGSITFNQVGREFPMGGMNEAGLVVEMMWLAEAEYPARDSRPAVMELQWIQYILDTSATIAEAKTNNSLVRIMPSESRLHFLLLDHSGKTAVVEFINGQTLFYSGDDLPVPALTNKPYTLCLAAIKEFQGFGGSKPLGTTIDDPDRFVTLADSLKKPIGKGNLLDRAFEILDQVHCDYQESPTQWRIVYDPLNLEIHFQTLENTQLRTIRFQDFSFSCSEKAKVLDLQSAGSGNVGKTFDDYSLAVNDALVHKTFGIYKKVGFGKEMPEMYLMVLAGYPESLICH